MFVEGIIENDGIRIIKMKRCPFCAEEIQDDAIKCKHCKSMLVEENSAVSSDVFDDIRQPSKKLIKFTKLMAVVYFVLAIIGAVSSHYLWKTLFESPSSSELFLIATVSSVISASLIGLVFKTQIEGFKGKHYFVFIAGSIIIAAVFSLLRFLSLPWPIAISIDPILSGILMGFIFRTIFDKFSFRYICALCVLLIVLNYTYVLIYKFIPYTYTMENTIRFWINIAIRTCLWSFRGALIGFGIGSLLKKTSSIFE